MWPERIYDDADAERIRGCVDKSAQDWKGWLESLKAKGGGLLQSAKGKGGELLSAVGVDADRHGSLGYGALGGAAGGGLLSYLAARRAQKYRDPEDRTGVLGQTLSGALLGATAVPAGMEAVHRLGRGIGGVEDDSPQTVAKSLGEGWGFTTGALAAGGRGAYHGINTAKARVAAKALNKINTGVAAEQIETIKAPLDELKRYVQGKTSVSVKPFDFQSLGYPGKGLPEYIRTPFTKLNPQQKARLKSLIATESAKLKATVPSKTWLHRGPGQKTPSGWVTLATMLGAPIGGAVLDKVRYGTKLSPGKSIRVSQ